jgi:glycerol-3-phosphate dehydrogenase
MIFVLKYDRGCSIQTYILICSGTSSKSTKLVHGGVRYLQKAVFELDYDQFKLVREALHERRIFLQTAPYLSAMLPIMLPIYKSVVPIA